MENYYNSQEDDQDIENVEARPPHVEVPASATDTPFVEGQTWICPDSGDVNIYLEGDFTLSPAHASAGHSYSGNRGKMTLEEADFPPLLMTWFKSGKSNESIKKSLQDKFNKVEEQLKSYMQQHASLNTAIKELPELEQYVPEEYMEKLHAPSAPRGKVQRAEKTTVEDLGIDRDALTSAAVAHQLTRDGDD